MIISHRTSLFVALASLIGCAAESGEIAGASNELIHGEDTRQQWFEIADEKHRDVAANSVASMMDRRLLVWRDGQLDFSTEEQQRDYNVCSYERFLTEPVASKCGVTLIDDDIVATAAHCFSAPTDCAVMSFVFDYRYRADGELEPMTRDDVFHCQRVLYSEWDVARRQDAMFIQLDRKPTQYGRKIAPLAADSPTPLLNDVFYAGYLYGLPLKYDMARVGGTTADAFYSALDIGSGLSGSGIFLTDGSIVGVHSGGGGWLSMRPGESCVSELHTDEGDFEARHSNLLRAVDRMCVTGVRSQTLCGTEDPVCGDGICNEAPSTCQADCQAPPEWFCGSYSYNYGRACNCECGAYDPDCDDLNNTVISCEDDELCGPDGHCAPAAAVRAASRADGVEPQDVDEPVAEPAGCSLTAHAHTSGLWALALGLVLCVLRRRRGVR